MDGTTKYQRTEEGGWWCHADHKWCGDGRDGDWWKSDEWWVRREDQQQDRQGRQGGGQRVPTPPPPPAAESDPASPPTGGGRRKTRRGKTKDARGAEFREKEDKQEQCESVPDGQHINGREACVSIKVGNAEFEEKDAVEGLLNFLKQQQLDSFAMGHLCRELGPDRLVESFLASPLFQKSQAIGSAPVMVLGWPASCPHRPRLEEQVGPEGDDAAKKKLISRALGELKERGAIDADQKPMKADSTSIRRIPKVDTEPVFGNGGKEQRARLKRQLCEWGKDADGKVQMYIIDCEGCGLGLVTNSCANFCYQLCLEGVPVRLQPVSIDWLPRMNEAERREVAQCILDFHAKCMGAEDGLPEMLVVKIDGNSLDVQRMQQIAREASVNVPWWLAPIVSKMARMNWWETVRLSAPSDPPPSPMSLHAIFDEGRDVTEEREFDAARKTLAQCGWDALALMKAIVEVADDRSSSRPALSGVILERRIHEYLAPERLAEFIRSSHLPHMGNREGLEEEALAEMLLALAGAHKLDSDMFAVSKLWTWLSGDPALENAHTNTAAGARFMGRTPSYLAFGEVEPPVEDGMPKGRLYLKVRYEEYDDAFYRWNGRHAEERRPDVPGASGWRRLVWNQEMSAFASPSMLTQDGKCRALPNKVSAWLRGRTIAKLACIKRCEDSTPRYSHMREEVEEEEAEAGRIGTGTMLILTYVCEKRGRVIYRRSRCGGLGTETGQNGRVHLLMYSETKKTLLSPIDDHPLPRKVVTWLLEGRCMSDLIPKKKRGGPAQAISNDDGIVSSEEVRDGCIYVRARVFGTGVIYEGRRSQGDKWRSLTFNELSHSWIDDSGDEDVTVQDGVIAAADEYVRKRASNDDMIENAPRRLDSPTAAKALFPQLSGTDLADIEQRISHRFKQSRLLAEALTHCSATGACVMSCEVLAAVGDVVIRAYTSERACKEDVMYFTAQTVTKPDPPACGSFCSPRDWPSWASTKSSSMRAGWKEPDCSLRTVQDLQCRLRACCNHTSYAISCVTVGLHTAVHRAQIPDLEQAIQKVERAVVKGARDKRIRRMFRKGTPKVLGDVFAACVGAIVMDSDHTEAGLVLAGHFQECRRLDVSAPSSVSRGKDDLMVTKHAFQIAAAGAGECLSTWVVKMQEADGETALADFRLACMCSDVCIEEVNGEVLVGNSPRATASRRCWDDETSEDESEDDDQMDSEHEQDAVEGDQTDREHDGFIYCRYCEMWLNGPTQWADHEIGKKHRRAVARTGKPGKQEVPPIPRGFGKGKPLTEQEDVAPEDVSIAAGNAT